MRHVDGRFVPDAPAGVRESPHQVDVLADAQGLVERDADGVQRGPADDECRTRHVRDPRARHDPRRQIAEVEAAALAGVAAGPRVVRLADDARCDGGDEWIGQMREQRGKPAAGRCAVAVDEGDELALHMRQSGVARGARTAVFVAPHEGRVMGGADSRDTGDVVRCVVDDNDRHVAAECREAAVEVGEAIVRGDDHGHVVGRRRGRDGVGQPGVGQAARQHG